ncbi:MAG: hypothetical protein H6730_16040 [Deltaproteobacteria bacterium]|nr:hypothetical protein [Deltaproteobacteria bacterium]
MFEVGEDAQQRPHLAPHLTAFVAALGARAAFRHLDPARILFVAGAARRGARASVRGLAVGPDEVGRGLGKPTVIVAGRRMLYEVCLRPRFFLAATPAERARILAHELWHIGPGFDGRLHPDRRHQAASAEALDAALDADLDGFDPRRTELWPLLERKGELRMPAWLDRPPSLIPQGSAGHRAAYDERDLFSAVVLQR